MTDTRATVTVEIILNGVRVPIALDADALAAIAAAITPTSEPEPESAFVTIKEAASYLRTTRGAIDHLLSAGKLARHKRGRRTLIARHDLEALVRPDERRRF